MTIKIKRLSVEKDLFTEECKDKMNRPVGSFNKLKGAIIVELSEGIVTGHSEVSVESVSQDLQAELYKVLDKIENELNGVGNDEASKEESINITFNVSNVSGNSTDIEGFAKKIADTLKRQQGLR